MVDPATVYSAVTGLFSGYNVAKVFSSTALRMEILFTNNSNEPLKLYTTDKHYCELEVKDPAELPDDLLMPG